MSKELGQRSDAELAEMFSSMYSGWERGVNVTQERFGNGDTRFTETPMTPMELAARYVAAEVGANIYEIAGRAAFAPIIVYSQIQARIGPVFEEAATALEAKDAKIEVLNKSYGLAVARSNEWRARAEQAERALAEAVEVINRQTNNALAAADLLADGAHRIDVTQDEWREHAAATEAARAFVAQHGSDSGKERK